MLEQLSKWWSDLGAEAELRWLDDRMLADMGIEREEIRARVRGPESREAGSGTGAGARGRLARGRSGQLIG